MRVPLHATLRDDPPPRGPVSERALHEQRARLALAHERQPGDGSCCVESRRGAEWTIAPLRVACVVSLMLVALCAMTANASAMPGSWPQATATGNGEMRFASFGSRHMEVQPFEVSEHATQAFNWTDAGVGAAFGAVLVPLLVGSVLLLNRRWENAQVPARSRPRPEHR
jgi:hypothetical protein